MRGKYTAFFNKKKIIYIFLHKKKRAHVSQRTPVNEFLILFFLFINNYLLKWLGFN